MSMLRVALTAALLTLLAPSAHAFFDPPWVTPALPRAGEVVYLNVSGGICDVFLSVPGYPEVTQQGTAIHVVEYGHHETFQDFCIYGLWTVAVPIGALASGDYTVTADFLYDDPLTGLTTVNLGVVPFTVVAAPTVMPVPTAGMPGLFALLLRISISALWAMREQPPT